MTTDTNTKESRKEYFESIISNHLNDHIHLDGLICYDNYLKLKIKYRDNSEKYQNVPDWKMIKKLHKELLKLEHVSNALYYNCNITTSSSVELIVFLRKKNIVSILLN